MTQQLIMLQPNLFELRSSDIQITYSTSSIAGIPQLSYSNQNQTWSFSGSEIQTEASGLGESVTVLLKNNQADEGLESLTLLIPLVQLASAQEISIQTLAILNKRVVFVNPASPIQLQTYDAFKLRGTARLVEF